MDVLLGDISYPNLVALTNGGTVNSSNMVAVDEAFASYTMCRLNYPSSRHPSNWMWMATGCGTYWYAPLHARWPRIMQVSGSIRTMGPMRSGLRVPTAGSFPRPDGGCWQWGVSGLPSTRNGDGLQDIILANDGYYPSLDYTGKLALFLNVGSATDPAFELETEDYMGLSTSGIGSGMYPAFADLDGDRC